MGINFIKQFVGAGLSKDITLFGPGFSGDEDVIKAVGEPMLGMFNTSQWGHDMDNAANKKFVAEFEKAYGRLPTLYAAQGFDAARLAVYEQELNEPTPEAVQALAQLIDSGNRVSAEIAARMMVSDYPSSATARDCLNRAMEMETVNVK
jgi:ABC-type branched-subunit amino acid transport system substrate-binding protein